MHPLPLAWGSIAGVSSLPFSSSNGLPSHRRAGLLFFPCSWQFAPRSLVFVFTLPPLLVTTRASSPNGNPHLLASSHPRRSPCGRTLGSPTIHQRPPPYVDTAFPKFRGRRDRYGADMVPTVLTVRTLTPFLASCCSLSAYRFFAFLSFSACPRARSHVESLILVSMLRMHPSHRMPQPRNCLCSHLHPFWILLPLSLGRLCAI